VRPIGRSAAKRYGLSGGLVSNVDINLPAMTTEKSGKQWF